MKSKSFFTVLLQTILLTSAHQITVLLPTILLTSAHQMGSPNFECGPHGRFEYCIDAGNLGCIVGCHCHPGYYFDTESKICESNDKLRVNYRREYNDFAPTPTALTTTKLSPTPTESNIIDKNVDAIAKDADDLGDWLYNQFFKTIENQVINKTGEEKLPTRRSGSDSDAPKTSSTSRPKLAIQRRSNHKRSKKILKKKKRHSKKRGLRKKLLRISEDDSLFDSSSGSSESTGSSSSTSSESESTSTESDSTDSRSREHSHGHRKILMINKKPHPPLPSFIFMPNMETPYFPPLGLPPPPIMPMYPMIPIPPMMPSINIVQSTPAAAEAQATTAHSEAAAATTTATTAAATTAAAATTIAAEETDSPGADADAPGDDDAAPDAPPGRSGFTGRKHRKGNARQKFMRKLRDKMRRRHELPQTRNYFPDEINDPVLGRMNIPDTYPEPYMYDEPQEPGEAPPGQDVNFKYLSQLIHKINKSDVKHPPQKPGARIMPNPRNFKPSHMLKDVPERRQGNTNDEFMINEKNDYADLGRQIAALVRKIDTKGDHQINIDYEKTVSANIPPQAIFNNNGMSSRSYWERFARSPFKFTFDTEQYSDLDTREKLLSLEDQVSNTATTKRSLTLQQVENMINIIEAVKAAHDNRVKLNISQPKEITNAPSTLPKNPALLSEFERWKKRHISKYNMQPEKQNITNTFHKTHMDIYYKKSQPIKFNDTHRENMLPSAKTNRISDNLTIRANKTQFDKLMPDKTQFDKRMPEKSQFDKRMPEKSQFDKLMPEKSQFDKLTQDKHKFISYPPQRFKLPLSRLLQHAAMQQSHLTFPTRNIQKPKPTSIYLPPLQRPPKVTNYKNWGPRTGIYHYENIVSAPNFSLSPLNKPSSYFHQIHHFDYFD